MPSLKDCLEALSIIIAGSAAIYGIGAWQREHVGKRKIELAEDSLALFYEASDAIKYMRHPMSTGIESSELVQEATETDAAFRARRNANVVFYRYNQYQELFNKLHASRYRFMAQIGKTEAAPFDEIWKIVNEIKGSARVLSRLWSKDEFRNDQQRDQHFEQINRYEAIFWDGIEAEDPINIRMVKIISDIEATCQSIIVSKGRILGRTRDRIWKTCIFRLDRCKSPASLEAKSD